MSTSNDLLLANAYRAATGHRWATLTIIDRDAIRYTYRTIRETYPNPSDRRIADRAISTWLLRQRLERTSP